MIYLDSSVALAYLLAEDRCPETELWHQPLVSSRLLECEVWNRIHARGLSHTHAKSVHDLLARVAFVEMIGPVLAHALEPFPIPVRTLDAIHLAAMSFLRDQGVALELASYDDRLLAAARTLDVPEWNGLG